MSILNNISDFDMSIDVWRHGTVAHISSIYPQGILIEDRCRQQEQEVFHFEILEILF